MSYILYLIWLRYIHYLINTLLLLVIVIKKLNHEQLYHHYSNSNNCIYCDYTNYEHKHNVVCMNSNRLHLFIIKTHYFWYLTVEQILKWPQNISISTILFQNQNSKQITSIACLSVFRWFGSVPLEKQWSLSGSKVKALQIVDKVFSLHSLFCMIIS